MLKIIGEPFFPDSLLVANPAVLTNYPYYRLQNVNNSQVTVISCLTVKVLILNSVICDAIANKLCMPTSAEKFNSLHTDNLCMLLTQNSLMLTSINNAW